MLKIMIKVLITAGGKFGTRVFVNLKKELTNFINNQITSCKFCIIYMLKHPRKDVMRELV